jgi:hypothetical protein
MVIQKQKKLVFRKKHKKYELIIIKYKYKCKQ